MDEIVALLNQRTDRAYQLFQARLIPSIPPERILGVRTPELRALAQTLYNTPLAEAFLREMPHQYYEENNLHAFLLEREKDYGRLIGELNRFLPFVDNWATCDSLSPALFKKRPDGLPLQAHEWMRSDHEYTVRFGIGVLMRHYLGDGFRPEYAEWVAGVRCEAYYVRMMVAWYFATALAARDEDALPLLSTLPPWTRTKAIQKALESNRIPPERKRFLRSLR